MAAEEMPFGNKQAYNVGDWAQVPGVAHDDQVIKGFFGPYRWLSNFSPATVLLDGVKYQSVEQAYQAAKWPAEKREYFTQCTSQESVAYNRDNAPNLYSPNEWDVAKLGIMKRLLITKFNPAVNPDNAQKLTETGERYLEETNWWNDTYWGKNLEGKGHNNLGKLIMKIRDKQSDPVLRVLESEYALWPNGGMHRHVWGEA